MYSYKRNFYGKLRGCIFDWSGTLIDKYSIAPVKSLMDTFSDFEINVSGEEIRESMGIRKDKHIKEIMKIPNIEKQWIEIYDKKPTDSNIQEICLQYQVNQLDCISDYTEFIPAVKLQLIHLRNTQRLRLGGTTGFYNNITESIKKDIHKQGFVLDAFVSGDDVENGSRPNPFMLFKCMELMNINNVRTILKVDDTVSGVEEGLNAGVWTVGVSRYSNYMGINSLDELDDISITEYNERVKYSHNKLLHSGAHYVVENFNELPFVIKNINKRLKNGEQP